MLTARGLLNEHAPRDLHLPSVGTRHFTRLIALAFYGFALVAVLAILAPVLPSGYQGTAYDLRAVIPGLEAPVVASPSVTPIESRLTTVRGGPQSVALLALDRGTTPFELYALNPGAKLNGPIVDGGTRIRIPR